MMKAHYGFFVIGPWKILSPPPPPKPGQMHRFMDSSYNAQKMKSLRKNVEKITFWPTFPLYCTALIEKKI